MLVGLLTRSSLSGTRDKKSRSSLLGIVSGLRSFLVNLLMPHIIIRYRTGIQYSTKAAEINRTIAKYDRNGTVKLNVLKDIVKINKTTFFECRQSKDIFIIFTSWRSRKAMQYNRCSFAQFAWPLELLAIVL